jgi:glycosyltransferase involved in cell wall biosynthesis
MESEVVHSATALVFVTEEAAELVMKKYAAELRDKVAVVPHGFDAAALERAPHDDGRQENGPLRVVYTGRFYSGLRTPVALLHALARLNAEKPLVDSLEITFVGPFVTGFAQVARSLGVQHLVRFHEKVSVSKAQSIAAAADVLLVIDAPSAGPSPFLPSKLVDYLALRKPIVAITPLQGASASLVRRVGGLVAAPDDETGIAIALRDLLRRWRERTLLVGSEFDRVAADYDIRATTATFNNVLSRAFA